MVSRRRGGSSCCKKRGKDYLSYVPAFFYRQERGGGTYERKEEKGQDSPRGKTKVRVPRLCNTKVASGKARGRGRQIGCGRGRQKGGYGRKALGKDQNQVEPSTPASQGKGEDRQKEKM